MKRQLTIILDSDSKPQIRIAVPEDHEPDHVNDMIVLCEGLCTLMHAADRANVKPLKASLESCLKHLKDGASDSSYEGYNFG